MDSEIPIPALGIFVTNFTVNVSMGRGSEVVIYFHRQGESRVCSVIGEDSSSLDAWGRAVYNLFVYLGHKPLDVLTGRHSIVHCEGEDYIHVPFSDGQKNWEGKCEWSKGLAFDKAYPWAVVNGFVYWCWSQVKA